MTSAIVQVEAVSRRFGDNLAVDRVSLAITPGEVVGLLGANGAGKSTLIRMILGLIPATSGRISLFGAAPSRSSRARLGYVSQGLGLYADLTVAENLAFVASAFGVPAPPLPRELDGIADRMVGQVSLGYRRQVAFAAALSHGPELLVLDEPTSGVGPLGRSELWGTIGAAAERGAAVLVSTHYMEEAEQCDRLIMMSNGRAVAEGTSRDMSASVTAIEIDTPEWAATLAALRAAGLRAALVGSSVRVVGADLGAVTEALRRAGVDASVHETEAGFEEAFVAMSVR
jgi:ABC-type multidrug transport system ATPase subunit